MKTGQVETVFAKHVFPGNSPRQDDVYLTCVDGWIRDISRKNPGGVDRSFDGVLLPALVNAHTHLEFSDLDQPLGAKGMQFTDWVGLVFGHRRSRSAENQQSVIQSGLQELAESRTIAVGDISTFDYSPEPGPDCSIVDFRELIGFQDAQFEDQRTVAETHLQRNTSSRNGLSPHAPYSVNHQTIDLAIELSRDHQIPLAMHLAETREELELLANHTGPFRELLERLGIWQSGNFGRNSRPLDFLDRLRNAHRALVVHGNYLLQDELELISQNRESLKLVYCPRTHDFFGHSCYPTEAIQKLGIPLALGTDSRASNPDLNLWNEMEYLHERSLFSPLEILRQATLNGAEALGLEKELGTIEVGKRAEFIYQTDPEQPLVKALMES